MSLVVDEGVLLSGLHGWQGGVLVELLASGLGRNSDTETGGQEDLKPWPHSR